MAASLLVHRSVAASALKKKLTDLIADALVGLEVEGQLGVVTLDDDLGGPLNGLSTDATHFGELLAGRMFEEEIRSITSLDKSRRLLSLSLCGSQP